ncbi:MAG TPA: hypothetical protein VFQ20_02815 [Burkholderiaceae bacterium]|nr:hypothetical protein [Burkholderiaceae bacterium]
MQARHALLAALAAAAVSACAPALDWREVRPDGAGGLVLAFPCKPASHARMLPLAGAPVRTTLHACSAGDATWAVAFADIEDPARVTAALAALKAAAAANIAAAASQPLTGVAAGATPNPQAGRLALEGRYPDGRTARMQLAVAARGTVVVQVSVLGERIGRDEADSFFGSVRFTP